MVKQHFWKYAILLNICAWNGEVENVLTIEKFDYLKHIAQPK